MSFLIEIYGRTNPVQVPDVQEANLEAFDFFYE